MILLLCGLVVWVLGSIAVILAVTALSGRLSRGSEHDG